MLNKKGSQKQFFFGGGLHLPPKKKYIQGLGIYLGLVDSSRNRFALNGIPDLPASLHREYETSKKKFKWSN